MEISAVIWEAIACLRCITHNVPCKSMFTLHYFTVSIWRVKQISVIASVCTLGSVCGDRQAR